ncbi:GtrA family protein [Candidatus Kuenenbacteria bacterium]|nr:GtrA family protein [Candidatus Kuenenbacteria bacterium]
MIKKQFIKFAIVGIINTGLDFIFFNFLILMTGIYKGGWLGLLNFISFSLATTNSYFLNKFWTFKKKETSSFLIFFLISLAGCIINTSIVYSITTFIPPFFDISQLLWVNIAKLLAISISMVWNFIGYKFWVFRK